MRKDSCSPTCRFQACPLAPIVLTAFASEVAALGLVFSVTRGKKCKMQTGIPCSVLQYYHSHLYVAFFFFIIGASTFWALVEKLRFRAMWVTGALAGFAFVAGRIARDAEKIPREWGWKEWMPPALAISLFISALVIFGRARRPGPVRRADSWAAASLEAQEDRCEEQQAGCHRCSAPPLSMCVVRAFFVLFASCMLLLPVYVGGVVCYAVWEITSFLLVFIVAAFAQEPLQRIGAAGHWVAAWWCGVMFYAGREVRDAEQLGFWDAPGFNWPLYGLTIYFVAVQLLHMACKWRQEAKRNSLHEQDAKEKTVLERMETLE